jgi:hypothetical protein
MAVNKKQEGFVFMELTLWWGMHSTLHQVGTVIGRERKQGKVVESGSEFSITGVLWGHRPECRKKEC